MLTSENIDFFCPVKIHAGKKAMDHIPFELDSLGAANPFLITDKEAARTGVVKKVINAFKGSDLPLAVFDETGPVSDPETVKQAANLFKETGCDAVVALGGNPVVDMAKVLNISVSQETEDVEVYSTGKALEKPMKPFISIPCFPGDGNESGPHATVGKWSFHSSKLMPDLVVIDPAVISIETPSKITASAMRAITCASESCIGPSKNHLTEAFAHVAVRSVFLNLLNALRKKDWKKARQELLAAETISECAFINAKPGMAYSLGLEISRHCMVPRGLCMGVLLPHALDYVSATEGSFVSELLFPLAGQDLFAITAKELQASKVVSMLRDFYIDVYLAANRKIPGTLEDTGLPREKLKDIAQSVHKNSDGRFSYDGCLMVLEHTWNGSPAA